MQCIKEWDNKSMYRQIVFIALLISLLFLYSCGGEEGTVYIDDGKRTDLRLENVIEAINNHDKGAIQATFSKQALNEAEDLDGRMDYLFDFVQGSIKSWEPIVSGALDGYSEQGHKLKKIRSWYNVKTDKKEYLFFFYEFTEDTDNPDNIGLYMLQVIKAKDKATQFDGGQHILCAGIYHPSIINNFSTKLTSKELNKLEFLRADWTENQMLGDGFELKQNNEFDRIYSKGCVEYHYGNEFGNGETPDWVSVSGSIDVPGPRLIAVGDRFEDVILKFPNEENWEESEKGEIYGKYEDNDDQPYQMGSVRESGDTKVISVYPEEGIPCLFIYFKNDVVVSYKIELQFLNP